MVCDTNVNGISNDVTIWELPEESDMPTIYSLVHVRSFIHKIKIIPSISFLEM